MSSKQKYCLIFFFKCKQLSKKVNFLLVFTESQHLMKFSPIMQLWFQRIKRGLLHILLHRSYSICSDFKAFHLEINHLKSNLRKNNYPPNFIDSSIMSFFITFDTPKVIVQSVPIRMFLVSCCSWEVLRFKFERISNNCLLTNWRLVI